MPHESIDNPAEAPSATAIPSGRRGYRSGGPPGPSASDVLASTIGLGIVVGLVEAVGLLAYQALINCRYVTIQILWASPLFDAILFAVVGLVSWMALRAVPRASAARFYIFPVAVLIALDGLEVLALSTFLARYALLLLALGGAATLTRWFLPRMEAVVPAWRKGLPWLLAGLGIVLVGIEWGMPLQERWATSQLPKAVSGRPNVLIVVVDTLRADHLGCYGYTRRTSANLDRTATSGVLFENAFATAPWTLPSHATLLSGRYPFELGIDWRRPYALQQSTAPTLGEALAAEGYRTGAVSANVYWFTHDRLGRGFLHFEDYFHTLEDAVFRPVFGRLLERALRVVAGQEDNPARKTGAEVTDAALRWIDGDRDRPFFLMLNYFDVHDPYLPTPPYASRFSKSGKPPGVLNWRLRRTTVATAGERQDELDAYDGCIAELDDHLDELLRGLEQRGLRDDTLVVITADHGESFSEHGWYLHGHSLYLEQLHVPLIVLAPHGVARGVRIADPVSLASIPATVMDLIGGPATFPGPSLRLLWDSPPAKDPDWPAPIAENGENPWSPAGTPAQLGAMRSIVTPTWHFIEHDVLGDELFEWPTDRGESRNLIGRPEAAELRRRLVTSFSGSRGEHPPDSAERDRRIGSTRTDGTAP